MNRLEAILLRLATMGLIAAAAASAAAADALEPGLLADVRSGGRRLVFPIAEPHVTLAADESLHPTLGSAFSATLRGFLIVPEAGRYRFVAPGATLTIGGNRASDQPMALPAGQVPLELSYQRAPGPFRFELRWSSEAFAEEPVSSQHLRRLAGDPAALAGARVTRGRNLVVDLRCGACHAGGPTAPADAAAPILSGIGERVGGAWLAKWLAAPRAVRADARMPALLTPDESRDVAAFLVGGGGPSEATPVTFEPGAEGRGRDLFGSIGCSACHERGLGALAGLEPKTHARALISFLRNPLATHPGGRMPSLGLGDAEARAIAAFLLAGKSGDARQPVRGNAERGRALVASRGCLRCHDLQGANDSVDEPAAPPFASLRPERGCLSAAPPAGAARYTLDQGEREAIGAFLRAGGETSRAPVVELARMTTSLGCGNCHELHAPPAVRFEESPPPLSHAGTKLRTAWLHGVLVGDKRLRPWLRLRMPRFGQANGSALAPLFAASSGARDDVPDRRTADASTVRAGIRYIGRGEEGLGCITCHDWGRHQSLGGTPGPDMLTMVERLRPGWFERWLSDPGRVQPGTQMPNFFGALPREEARTRIAQLWGALSLGIAAPKPQGLPEERRVVLTVRDRPIAMRTFLRDASLRTLAVGLPGQVSYAFDTGACRLELAWTGPFLDVTDVWVGRGGEAAQLAGRRFYTGGPESLRIGTTRPATRRFISYRTVGRAVELSYELDGVRVEETITAHGVATLVRTFVIKGHGDRPVSLTFAPQPGISHTSSVGTISADGTTLTVPAAQAGRFSVTIDGTGSSAKTALAGPGGAP